MRKNLIIIISVLTVFALSVAAFALTRGAMGSPAADSCCTGDSCPMKKKKEGDSAKHDCCESADCCKKGDAAKTDSCPMKKHADHKADAVAADQTEQNVVVVKGETCCDCSCCADKKKKTAAGV